MRTQCDYLFITQKAKFSENFPCTSKHNQPALGINNSPHKQFMKLLLSVQNKRQLKRNCLLCICSSYACNSVKFKLWSDILVLDNSKSAFRFKTLTKCKWHAVALSQSYASIFGTNDQSGVSNFALYVIIPIKDNNPSLHSFFFIRTFFIRTSRLQLAKILRTCQEHTQAEFLLRTSLSCLHIL